MPPTRTAIFNQPGHFTAMHNALFDHVQPLLSLSAWSVLCVIVRRTKGWGKRFDAISYEQIKAATGIKSSTTIARALDELLSTHPFGTPILRRQASLERAVSRREPTRYALNPRFELDIPAPQSLSQTEFTPPSYSPENEPPIPTRPPENEPLPALRPPNSEHTKEPPISYAIGNRECEHARAPKPPISNSPSFPPNSPPAKHPNSTPTTNPPLFHAVCAATLRDPTIVSPRMRGQLAACARTLERAGYTAHNIELAATRWPYPTAPHPSQLLDNIQSLLNAQPAPPGAPPSSRATDSSHPAPRPPRPTPRHFESAADRKNRKWADWLSDLTTP